jgi:hypothetical protein
MLRDQAARWTKILVFLLTAVFFVPTVNPQTPEGRKAISHPAPVYPPMAKKYGVHGSVKVEVVVAPDGHIRRRNSLGGIRC